MITETSGGEDEKTIPFPIHRGTGPLRGRLMLAGDLIAGALRRLGSSFTFDTDGPPLTVAIFDQGGTDPGNIAEFLAFDLDFDVEPTTGFIFPKEADRG